MGKTSSTLKQARRISKAYDGLSVPIMCIRQYYNSIQNTKSSKKLNNPREAQEAYFILQSCIKLIRPKFLENDEDTELTFKEFTEYLSKDVAESLISKLNANRTEDSSSDYKELINTVGEYITQLQMCHKELNAQQEL